MLFTFLSSHSNICWHVSARACKQMPLWASSVAECQFDQYDSAPDSFCAVQLLVCVILEPWKMYYMWLDPLLEWTVCWYCPLFLVQLQYAVYKGIIPLLVYYSLTCPLWWMCMFYCSNLLVHNNNNNQRGCQQSDWYLPKKRVYIYCTPGKEKIVPRNIITLLVGEKLCRVM